MTIPKKLTFLSLVNNSVSSFSERPALGYVGKKPLTYYQVGEKVRQLRDQLTQNGINKGDKVVLLAQNMPHWGVSYLAVTSMGAVVVPVLIDFTAEEIFKILQHSEAKGIIVSEKQAHKLSGGLPDKVKFAILMDNFAPLSLGNLELNGSVVEAKATPNTVAGKPAGEPSENDLAAILYTSGTTGKPKGVMLSHKNILSNAANTLDMQPVVPEDRLLSVLPLPHTYECTISFVIPFMSGASVYYLDKLPTPAVLLPAMQEVKPTMMLTVPLIIEKVYQNRVLPKLTGSAVMRTLMRSGRLKKLFHRLAIKKINKAFGGHLHFFGIGGAKLNPETERFLRNARFPYAIGYGLTETAPLVAGSGPQHTKFQSTGPVIPGQEMRILDPNPHTGEGEVLARGPNVMQGYYKEPELTREVFTSDGWFKTGDLGVIDEDGYLFIKGRLKNVIISSTGENIYPEDIEAVINTEQHVQESLVYELKGKLVAKVHLNYEEIDKRYHELKESAGQSYQELKESAGQSYQGLKESAGQSYQELKSSANQLYAQAQEKVKERLEEIQRRVNARLNRFSRLTTIEEQDEPFEKTPTKKIKRFLYHDKKKEDS